MSTMLYKKGNMIDIEGINVDYIIVEDKEIEGSLKNGWVKHPIEIKEIKKKKS